MFLLILKQIVIIFINSKKLNFILINIYNQKHFRPLSVNNLCLLTNVPGDLGCP
jgi:hypothetical protein